MKIEKSQNNNVILKNDNGDILHIITTKVFIQTHPRADAVLLSHF